MVKVITSTDLPIPSSASNTQMAQLNLTLTIVEKIMNSPVLSRVINGLIGRAMGMKMKETGTKSLAFQKGNAPPQAPNNGGKVVDAETVYKMITETLGQLKETNPRMTVNQIINEMEKKKKDTVEMIAGAIKTIE